VRALMGGSQALNSHVNWALGYPGRVYNRMQGLEPDGGRGTDVTLAASPMMNHLNGIGALRPGRYQPGQRESENVIDRRPTSPWDYR
jgi:hypothetical protein